MNEGGRLDRHECNGHEAGLSRGDGIFSCGHQGTLLELQVAVQWIKEEVSSTLPAGVLGFADDTTVFFSEKGVDKVISSGRGILGRHRVRWWVIKFSILVPPESKVLDSGTEVLGTSRNARV